MVGDNLAFHLLHAQGTVGDADLEVFLNLHLAAKAHAGLYLLTVELALLGFQYLAAAFYHLNFALAAVGLAAAG